MVFINQYLSITTTELSLLLYPFSGKSQERCFCHWIILITLIQIQKTRFCLTFLHFNFITFPWTGKNPISHNMSIFAQIFSPKCHRILSELEYQHNYWPKNVSHVQDFLLFCFFSFFFFFCFLLRICYTKDFQSTVWKLITLILFSAFSI